MSLAFVETITSLINEEAWIATGNLGAEERVKEGGGAEIMGFTPKEGTVGWMDAEIGKKVTSRTGEEMNLLDADDEINLRFITYRIGVTKEF